MTRTCLNLSFLASALVLVAGHAFGQTAVPESHCGDRAQVVERLASKYGESRQSIGLGANNQVMEVFASLETGTWTITVTQPTGKTCLIATGKAFEPMDEVAHKGEVKL